MHNLIQFLGAVGAIFSVLAVNAYVAVGQKVPAKAATRTQIVLLGTGTPRADPERSGPATAIVVNGTPYLVDAGPGIVRRAAAAYNKGIKGLAIPNLQTAFITHLHSDHTVGYRLPVPPLAADRTIAIKVLPGHLSANGKPCGFCLREW